MTTNFVQLLRNPNIEPTNDVIAQALGSSNTAYIQFTSALPDLEIQLNWRYYTDGKAWLAKGTTSKEGSRGGKQVLTVFWLSMWNGFFKVTVFIPESVRLEVFNQTHDQTVRQKILDANTMGKLKFFPVVFEIRHNDELDGLMALIIIRKAFR